MSLQTNIKYIDNNGELQRRRPKTGVLLLNIGSALSEEHNRIHLIQMFTDRDLMKLPCQNVLGRLIAYMITNKSNKKHKLVGGYSHINYWTSVQAEMLREYLDFHSPETAPHIVLQAQRYSEPSADDAVQELLKLGVEFCVALPLYPQYSITTTLSSLRSLDKALDTYDCFGKIKWGVIQSFNSHPLYLKLIIDSITKTLNEFPEDERHTVNIIFSAHSLPISIIESGDLYQSEIEKNIRKIGAMLHLPNPIYLSWQSQEGKNWLGPKTVDVIKSISYKEGYGNANVIVFALSFVSDNIETLYDIDIVQANTAKEYGIKCFKRCECFNDDPKFIELLGQIFQDHIKILNNDIKVQNEDDLDKILNITLIDNNIKRYIDGPVDGKKKFYGQGSKHLLDKSKGRSLELRKRHKLILFILILFILIAVFFS